jgi:hypothetical protein
VVVGDPHHKPAFSLHHRGVSHDLSLSVSF